jgi:hypothetical protein
MNEIISVLETRSMEPKFPTEGPQEIKNLIKICIDWKPQNRPSFVTICQKLNSISVS